MRCFRRHLLRDTLGGSAVEFALVLPVLLMFMLGIIDIGRLMWTWNRAEKATQVGVRYATVTNFVPSTLASQNFALTNGVPGGDPVPTSAFSSTTCDTNTCTNSWGYNSAAFDNLVARMDNVMPEISDANVEIVYENVGLGYAGDPHGPDVAPLITVKLKGMTFEPVMLALFSVSIPLPDFRAALTAEDGAGTVSN